MNPSARIRRVDFLVALVAVLAVTLRNDHEIAAEYTQNWGTFLESRWSRSTIAVVAVILRVESDLMAALVVVTIGLGLVAIRKPWRPGRGRWPGRGMAAILVGALAILPGVISVGLEVMTSPVSPTTSRFDARFLSNLFRNCQATPAHAILGAWLLLALAGRWRSSEGGFGRLGRWVGWCWLASIVFNLWRSTLW